MLEHHSGFAGPELSNRGHSERGLMTDSEWQLRLLTVNSMSRALDGVISTSPHQAKARIWYYECSFAQLLI